jgi:mRNA interferase MazF
MEREIKRGDIYWVDWSPGRGSEQSGIRPGVVIQNDMGNKFSPTTIIAACSTANIKTYPFTVSVTKQDCGLPKECVINCSAILTVDKTCLGDKCGRLNEIKMAQIDEAIKRSLGLN